MVVAAWLACPAHAIPFDCAKPANADENKICSEVLLAKLDDEFANGVKLVNANMSLPMRDYVKRSQDAWSALAASPRSGSCKGDAVCITGKCREPMAYLRNPHLPYEDVYAAKKSRFTLESFASGALRYGFYPDGGMNVYVKEAKKKACDKFKGIAGAYARDYAQAPAQ